MLEIIGVSTGRWQLRLILNFLLFLRLTAVTDNRIRKISGQKIYNVQTSLSV